jgi:hypothetical protein
MRTQDEDSGDEDLFSFETILISDKKRVREALERLLADYLKAGGRVKRLGRSSFEEAKERRHQAVKQLGKKRPKKCTKIIFGHKPPRTHHHPQDATSTE